jgi:hypothetical protein
MRFGTPGPRGGYILGTGLPCLRWRYGRDGGGVGVTLVRRRYLDAKR